MDFLDKLRIAFRLKRRVVDPKMYLVVLESPDGTESLHAVTDYSLESAFAAARKDAKDDTPSRTDARPKMWSILTLDEVLRTVTDMRVEGEAVPDGKNRVMHEIIASKDPAVLERRKGELTEAEYAYLKDALADKAA